VGSGRTSKNGYLWDDH